MERSIRIAVVRRIGDGGHPGSSIDHKIRETTSLGVCLCGNEVSDVIGALREQQGDLVELAFDSREITVGRFFAHGRGVVTEG